MQTPSVLYETTVNSALLLLLFSNTVWFSYSKDIMKPVEEEEEEEHATLPAPGLCADVCLKALVDFPDRPRIGPYVQYWHATNSKYLPNCCECLHRDKHDPCRVLLSVKEMPQRRKMSDVAVQLKMVVKVE